VAAVNRRRSAIWARRRNASWDRAAAASSVTPGHTDREDVETILDNQFAFEPQSSPVQRTHMPMTASSSCAKLIRSVGRTRAISTC
jgi:hypothetical protein